MNKAILISVIIPVYNAEKWIRQCVESVLKQTYNKLEIICIDDGSTDSSYVMLQEMAEKDNRIILIHQENRGESSARNRGLEIAVGQYITFIDCDDWIEQDMYGTMIEVIQKYNPDIVASSWYKDTGEVSQAIHNIGNVENALFDRGKLLKYIYMRDSYRGFAYMWSKLYNRKIFKNSDGEILRFDEALVLGGDVLMLGKLALNAKSAYYLNKAFYHYNQREGSGCHTKVLWKRKQWLLAYIKLIEEMKKRNIGRDVLAWVERFLVYHAILLSGIATEQNDSVVLEYCKEIIIQYQASYRSKNIQFPERIKQMEEILGN